MFEQYSLTDTLAVVVTGLVVVFLALVFLTILMWLFGKTIGVAFSEKANASRQAKKEAKKAGKKAAKKEASVSAPEPAAVRSIDFVDEEDDDEIIAVIAAAVVAMGQAEGRNYAIRSVKRAREARPAWSMAGIVENTRPFQY